MDSSPLWHYILAGCCEHYTEPSDARKVEERLDQLWLTVSQEFFFFFFFFFIGMSACLLPDLRIILTNGIGWLVGWLIGY
jgi:hypothetical protein